jgi:micrococcal nuclease
MLALLLCLAAVAIDGDSIRCANLGQFRLLGIDSADYRASRPWRQHFGDHVSSDGQARAAKASLKAALQLGPVRIEPVTRDRYGRTVALASAGGAVLSCWQLRHGVARYLAAYDNGSRVARLCARWSGPR